MKFSDDEKELRLGISRSLEFQRVKTSSGESCHGCIIIDDIPFIMFRNNDQTYDVFLSYLTIPHLGKRLEEIRRFATILADMLNHD